MVLTAPFCLIYFVIIFREFYFCSKEKLLNAYCDLYHSTKTLKTSYTQSLWTKFLEKTIQMYTFEQFVDVAMDIRFTSI